MNNEYLIALTQELLEHLSKLATDRRGDVQGRKLLMPNIVYVRAVALELDRLRMEIGPGRPVLWPQVIRLLHALAREDNPIRFVTLTNQLSRTFEHTPAEALSLFLLRRAQASVPPSSTRGGHDSKSRSSPADRGHARSPLPPPDAVRDMPAGSLPDNVHFRKREDVPPLPPSPAPEPRPDTFHFVLQGPSAGTDWIVAGTSAELRFSSVR